MSINHENVLKYLDQNFGISASEVQGDTLLFTSGLLDSFSVGDLLMFLEEQGNFVMEPEEVVPENLDSINYIVAFATAKAAAAEQT